MKMRLLGVLLALISTQSSLGQTKAGDCGVNLNCNYSSSSSAAPPSQASSAIPLPPAPGAPLHPKSLEECAAFQSQLEKYKSEIESEHAACIARGKMDRPWADGVTECNWSACVTLHNYLHDGGSAAADQQSASCRASAQQAQARLAAEQQGIQTLGDALTTLLTPTPATPIDSQNDLAAYEDQQKDESVAGDDASSDLSVDSSAQKIMASAGADNNVEDELQRQINDRSPASESGPTDQQLSAVDTVLSLIETSAQQIGEGFSNLKNSGAATALMEFFSTQVEPTFSSAVTDIGGVFISLEKGLLDPDVAKGVKAISDQANDPNKFLNANERNQMCATFPEECPKAPPKK